MKTHRLFPALLLLFLSLPIARPTLAADDDDPDAPKPTQKVVPIDGWGIGLNPAEDCEFKAEKSKLTITVPGTTKAHDLSPEISSSTAPRVVQAVEGDFVIQVRVDGEFSPGDDSTESSRTGYTGAGLVVFANVENFVRIERATLHSRGGEAHPYTNFEIRVDGHLERFGTTGDFKTEEGKPTWLRLERKGNQMLGAMSQDGENWSYGEPKELISQAWNGPNIVAGVAAISTSKQPFTPVYSELSLKQGAQAKAGNAEPAKAEPALEKPEAK